MAMVLTNRDSFPRKTGVDEGPLFSRSLLPVSRASGVSGFSQRCTNARARAHTRARSRDPGRSIQDRVAALLEGNSHSPKRKLIHHARIPPVISGKQSGEYYKSTSSPFHLLVPDRSPPPPLPLPPSLPPFLPSSLETRRSKKGKKKERYFAQFFDTFRLYIYMYIFLFYNLWTTTTVLGKHLFHPYFHCSVTDHAKEESRTHFRPPFRGNPSKL